MKSMMNMMTIVFGGCLLGCGTPAFFPQEYSRTAEAIAMHTLDSGVLDKYMARSAAQGINPEIVSKVAITYSASMGLDGVSAQVDLQSEGHGDGLGASQGLREQLAAKFADQPSLLAYLLSLLDSDVEGPEVPVPLRD